MTQMTTKLSQLVVDASKEDRAAALALFLRDQIGSVFGKWGGRLSAADQRKLFGKFIGKGRIVIDGVKETVEMTVRVCFGTDFDTQFSASWSELSAR